MKSETPMACPGEERPATERYCGPGFELKLISDRRGCAVWQAVGPKRTAALKVGLGEESATIVTREAEVLTAVGGPDALVAHGRGEGSAWMLAPWYEGPSTWETLHDVRVGSGFPTAARDSMADLCAAVAQWHSAGWVHADLQPQHSIHTPQVVRLIDCSWAWKDQVMPASPIFRGGLPHLLAPEVARSVCDGERPIAPSPQAEVYTLAAGLWWAITGAWPIDYAAVGIDPARMTAAVLRSVISSRALPLRLPGVWPDVQDVLGTALTEPPDRRPTAADLALQLRRVRSTDA